MAKLKVTITPPARLKESIKKKIEDSMDVSFRKEVALEVAEDIKINARRGYGIKDGKRISLAPLKHPETTDHRRYLEKAGNATARPYATDFSNLSMSGQLIDSIEGKLDSDGSINIGATGNREAYVKMDGSNSEADLLTNEELYKIHHYGDASSNLPARPIIGLREEMKARIVVKLREAIRRGLQTVFNVKKGS